MSESRTDAVTLTQIERFQFKANFAGSNTSMILDEPAPHGKNTGPSSCVLQLPTACQMPSSAPSAARTQTRHR